VEPREGGDSLSPSILVKRKEIGGGRMEEEGRTKSRLGETRDCSLTAKSRMDSGAFVDYGNKNSHQGGSWTKGRPSLFNQFGLGCLLNQHLWVQKNVSPLGPCFYRSG